MATKFLLGNTETVGHRGIQPTGPNVKYSYIILKLLCNLICGGYEISFLGQALIFYFFIIIILLQLSQFSPLCPPSPCPPPAPTISPYTTVHVCGAFMHGLCLIHSPSFHCYPPTHPHQHQSIYVSGSILLDSLFCSLDSSYK